MEDIKSPKEDKETKDLPSVESVDEPKKEDNPQHEKYDVSHAPTPHVVKVKKSPFKAVMAVLLIVALAGTSGYLGYMYLQEKDNANNLQQQLNSSQSQTPAQSDSAGQQQPQAGDISYAAEVGKFTLTLPSEYVIIKNIDGGFEGGPVTDLEVAKTSDKAGVISGSYSPNKVMSTQKQGGTLEAQIQSRNQEFSDVVELAAVKVDGIDAKVYRLSGLSDVNRVFFENDDNLYEFETLAPETQDELSDDMNAIIAGFKFNQ